MARDLAQSGAKTYSFSLNQSQQPNNRHGGRDHSDRVITPDRLHYSDTDSDDDGIPEQSEMIFRQFLSQRFAEENLSDVPAFPQLQRVNYYNQRPSISGLGYSMSLSDELTRGMTNLAEAFRRSGGRQEVAEEAANIDLSTLTQENLSLLLSQVFEDGVTPARLLVLFYFCSDLAVRAARSGVLRLLTSVTSWSLSFVRGAVSAWVKIRGGWSSLLKTLSPISESDCGNLSSSQTVSQVAFVSACAAVVGACAFYIKKNL